MPSRHLCIPALLLSWLATSLAPSAHLAGADPAPAPAIAPHASPAPACFEGLQHADGCWDDGPSAPALAPQPAAKPLHAGLCTGLVTLMFLGAGYDHLVPSRHQQAVRRGLRWMLLAQGQDGSLPGSLSADALQSMALCGAYAMTSDPELAGPCARALAGLLKRRRSLPWLHDAQAWADDDGFVTARSNALCIMALKSAFAAGLTDAGPGLAEAKRWLVASWHAANPASASGPGWFPAAMDGIRTSWTTGRADAASALVAAVFLHVSDDQAMRRSLSAAVADAPLAQAGGIDYAELWMRSIGMSQDTERWSAWAGRTRDLILATQATAGPAAGMWTAPAGAMEPALGTLSATACACLTLEVFQRAALIASVSRR